MLVCDPLNAQGTAVLCFPPSKNQSIAKTGISCSEPSVPGTIASYSCRNLKGTVYTGFLSCSASGVWLINLAHANNSLCNLDASIINFEDPDIVVVTEIPDFTTPIPNLELLTSDVSFLNDYEKVALQLHNVFRKNHGVPQIAMTKQLNTAAQKLVKGIIEGNDVDENWESEFKWNLINRTMNIETNWYFQIPSASDNTEAVSNAVQAWYSGFLKYDWNSIENNLEVGDALAFARVVWKATTFMGIGIFNSRNLTFVSCLYTPGRNIESLDPVQEFMLNVPQVRVG
ncbi:unnamed protein product [Orchesella dallaii]|uniref:SCP domain-containing protein n=1 Tax=Orchesella dallaii TaxID=48710 RepID=A0ABP1S9L1_9HEXA